MNVSVYIVTEMVEVYVGERFLDKVGRVTVKSFGSVMDEVSDS